VLAVKLPIYWTTTPQTSHSLEKDVANRKGLGSGRHCLCRTTSSKEGDLSWDETLLKETCVAFYKRRRHTSQGCHNVFGYFKKVGTRFLKTQLSPWLIGWSKFWPQEILNDLRICPKSSFLRTTLRTVRFRCVPMSSAHVNNRSVSVTSRLTSPQAW